MGGFREIEKNEVLNLWSKATHEELQVYIHNPFCPSRCNFCCYQGVLHNKKDCDLYYKKNLPKTIEMYKEVIGGGSKVKSWFFGGGTPSLASAEVLENTISKLPNFSDGKKTFEIHPNFWHVDQLDLLKERGFDNVIIGIQSFNFELLKRVNRVPASLSKIRELIEELKKRKINVLIDLIFLMEGKNKSKESNIFEEDIIKALSFEPAELTLQLNFNKDYGKNESIMFANSIINALKRNTSNYDFHSPIFKKETFEFKFFKDMAHSKPWKIIRLIRDDLVSDFEKEEFVGFLGQEPKTMSPGRSLLGMGSYNNEENYIFEKTNNTGSGKMTFSNINMDEKIFLVVEVTTGSETKFLLCD